MKIDGTKFMKWLHKIREEESLTSKGAGTGARRQKELELVKELIKKYRIPVVRV